MGKVKRHDRLQHPNDLADIHENKFYIYYEFSER